MGRQIAVDETGAPVRDVQGNVFGAVRVIRDITRRRGEEAELRKSRERLRASLQEKDKMLQEIHKRVKNNLQIISCLMSHQSERLEDEAVHEVFNDSEMLAPSKSKLRRALERIY